ncbi:hypothetical protein FGADI_86 [Fusarium gaditjirri]|uniref:Uncharacterized protein n=1 Tax=Fusarium gaditjirri TaxID=282569 RepID=A0A8H4TPF8_9HYPO|nr:hypothetical protein FGADI_86 [Fusarium gaditjirri]
MLVEDLLFPTSRMQLILRGVSSGDVYGTLREIPNVNWGTWLHLSNKDYEWPTSDLYGKEWLQDQFSTPYGMASLLEITVEAPYRVPTRLDFTILEKLFAAKAAAAEDHVWAMREDLNYFVEQISDMHDHVQLIGFRRKHTSTWGAAIADFLTNAYTLVEIFTEIHRITKTLREMQEKYASVVSPTEKLPDDYKDMIRHFLSFVLTSREVFLEKLEFLIKRSPRLRAAFVLSHNRPESRERPLTLNEHFFVEWVIWNLYDARVMLDPVEPWNRGFGYSAGDPSMAWSHDFVADRIDIWGQFKNPIKIEPTPDLVRFCEPNLGKFTYPVHRRRNKDNVEMMRRAEWNLDAFWARADEYLTFFSEPAKAKPKTRGTTTESTDNDQAPTKAMAQVTLEDPKPVFKVDRRALKTFPILFCDPDVTSTPGEVPWNDFLHAMASVGLAAEKLYGSVWQFSPYTLKANGSIHFHKPHPHNKVPFVIARRHGRRLYRTYGWTGEQFALEK